MGLCAHISVLARHIAGDMANAQVMMLMVPWAAHVAFIAAHEDVQQMMILGFRIPYEGSRGPWKGNLANAIAPSGRLVVTTASVRSSNNFERPERIDLDFLHPLAAAAQKPG